MDWIGLINGIGSIANAGASAYNSATAQSVARTKQNIAIINTSTISRVATYAVVVAALIFIYKSFFKKKGKR